MDNMNPGQPENKKFENSIPFDDSDEPLSLEDVDKPASGGISHSPLDLGSSRPVEVNNIKKPQPIQTKPISQAINMSPKAAQTSPTGKITGIKTFFTKLHVGALSFMEEQIMDWLKNNPGITVKQTNVCVGEVQAKKTEPNIIITIWY